MKRSSFKGDHILGILKDHHAGIFAADLCRKHGIGDAPLSNWRWKCRDMVVDLSPFFPPLDCNVRLAFDPVGYGLSIRWPKTHDPSQLFIARADFSALPFPYRALVDIEQSRQPLFARLKSLRLARMRSPGDCGSANG